MDKTTARNENLVAESTMQGPIGAWRGSSGAATEHGGISEVGTGVRASTAMPHNRHDATNTLILGDAMRASGQFTTSGEGSPPAKVPLQKLLNREDYENLTFFGGRSGPYEPRASADEATAKPSPAPVESDPKIEGEKPGLVAKLRKNIVSQETSLVKAKTLLMSKIGS